MIEHECLSTFPPTLFILSSDANEWSRLWIGYEVSNGYMIIVAVFPIAKEKARKKIQSVSWIWS